MADEQAKTTRGAQATDGVVDDKPKAKAASADKGFAPITPEDDTANPVKVAVPKNADEIAKEGTALGAAEAEATGGVVPFLSDEQPDAKRVWSLDADHNVNLRNGGPGSGTNPDLVEFGA